MKLVYHSHASLQGGTSPFVDALSAFENADPLNIVCPYIGFSFFASLVNRAHRWRLVTDLGEWVASTPPRQQSLIHRLIKAEGANIHHLPAVHAKVFWRPERALVGSANLTEMGLLARTEFGVLLSQEEDSDALAEIGDWFEWLWSRSTPSGNVNLGLAMLARAEQKKAQSIDYPPAFDPIDSEASSPLLSSPPDRFATPQRLKSIARTSLGSLIVAGTTPTPSLANTQLTSGRLSEKFSATYGPSLSIHTSVEDEIVSAILVAVSMLSETIRDEDGFRLAEISTIVAELFPNRSTRDIYFALTRSTVNHARGAYVISSSHAVWMGPGAKFYLGAGPVEASADMDRMLKAIIRDVATDGVLHIDRYTVTSQLTPQLIASALVALAESNFLSAVTGQGSGDLEDMDTSLLAGGTTVFARINSKFVWPDRWIINFPQAHSSMQSAIDASRHVYQDEADHAKLALAVRKTHNIKPSVVLDESKLADWRVRQLWKRVKLTIETEGSLIITREWFAQMYKERSQTEAEIGTALLAWANEKRISIGPGPNGEIIKLYSTTEIG